MVDGRCGTRYNEEQLLGCLFYFLEDQSHCLLLLYLKSRQDIWHRSGLQTLVQLWASIMIESIFYHWVIETMLWYCFDVYVWLVHLPFQHTIYHRKLRSPLFPHTRYNSRNDSILIAWLYARIANHTWNDILLWWICSLQWLDRFPVKS